MALVLTDEQAMLRDSARGLLEKNAPVSHLRALRDERDAAGFSRALWLKFAEMGFTGILVPEAFGGSGLGHVEAGVVMQEIGRTLTPSPFLSTALLAAAALARAGNAARLAFDNVEVTADAVLGEVDQGARVLDGVLNVGRAAIAAELVGAGEEAFGRTVRFLKERRQFGKLIGEFQALQHRAAHLFAEIEITQAAVLKALQALDENFDAAGPIVSVAKARAAATAGLAVQEAVQMHGGIGMTDEFEIGFFMKRVRVAQELFGDANFHADRLARLRKY